MSGAADPENFQLDSVVLLNRALVVFSWLKWIDIRHGARVMQT